jgi:hypothetical protein
MTTAKACGTQYPAESYAQRAGMSLRAYQDFVWSATNRDWAAVRERQAPLADRLEEASEVRIVSGDSTDIHAHVDGMHAENDYGERNLPGGEVYIAPVIDAADGDTIYEDGWYVFEEEFVREYVLDAVDQRRLYPRHESPESSFRVEEAPTRLADRARPQHPCRDSRTVRRLWANGVRMPHRWSAAALSRTARPAGADHHGRAPSSVRGLILPRHRRPYEPPWVGATPRGRHPRELERCRYQRSAASNRR